MYFHFENKNKSYQLMHLNRLTADPHMHGHFEIVILYDGIIKCVADDAEVTLHPKDLFISFPNQIHYYMCQTELVDARVIIITPDACPEYKDLFKRYIPEIPILKDALGNPNICNTIETMYQYRKDESEYTEPLLRGATLILLSELFRNLKMISKEKINVDLAKDIIHYCYENYDNDISLQSIADTLHISRYYISHLFSKRLHISFSDYINSLRVKRACELLKHGEMTITEIAYAVGYNSTRTFNRCFLNIRGMTPKEYRQIKKKA
ncbi:MAG: AraC family transcriptional regulator [Clostridia bacterium]|nr:AraC family transcriptional regulator [Clostridia bacterium]